MIQLPGYIRRFSCRRGPIALPSKSPCRPIADKRYIRGCAAVDGNAGMPRQGLSTCQKSAGGRAPQRMSPAKDGGSLALDRAGARRSEGVSGAIDAEEPPANRVQLSFVGGHHVVARTAPLSATVLLKTFSFRTTTIAGTSGWASSPCASLANRIRPTWDGVEKPRCRRVGGCAPKGSGD
jgi:hypothetical protein